MYFPHRILPRMKITEKDKLHNEKNDGSWNVCSWNIHRVQYTRSHVLWMKCPRNGFIIGGIAGLDFNIYSLIFTSASTLTVNIWWLFSKYCINFVLHNKWWIEMMLHLNIKFKFSRLKYSILHLCWSLAQSNVIFSENLKKNRKKMETMKRKG